MQEFSRFYDELKQALDDPKFQKDVKDADEGVQAAARRMRQSVLAISKTAKDWRARSMELTKAGAKKKA